MFSLEKATIWDNVSAKVTFNISMNTETVSTVLKIITLITTLRIAPVCFRILKSVLQLPTVQTDIGTVNNLVNVPATLMKLQTVFPAALRDIGTVTNLVRVLAILTKIQTVFPAALRDIILVINSVNVHAILMKIQTVAQKDFFGMI